MLTTILKSCSAPRNYQFIATNNTSYMIDSIQFGCVKNSIKISVAPHCVTDTLTYYFSGTIFNFTEPLLCLTVLNHSDSIRSYTSSYGGVIAIKNLKKRSVNNFIISLDTNLLYNPNIFNIKLE